MKSEFKLWPVGQGLFYSGNIKYAPGESFNFVYDCGSSSQNIDYIVDNYVARYDLKSKPLDMLVISHFDKDHVSSIPKLLREVSKVKRIFIPYAGGLQNYLLFLALIYGNDGNLAGKVDEIIQISVMDSKNDEEQTIDINELRIEEEVNNIFGIPGVRIGSFNESSIDYKKIWKFKFYNTYLRTSKSLSYIESEILNLMNSEGCSRLSELLEKLDQPLSNNSSKTVKKALEDIYIRSCSSSIKNSKMNQSSLCLYHSPFNERVSNRSASWAGYTLIHHPLTMTGTMLTGDISLRDIRKGQRYDHFKQHYKNEISKVGYFLMPHHGSANNWTEEVLNDFQTTNFFLNSASLCNTYGHPSARVVLDIVKSNRQILCCNEQSEVFYYF